MVPLQPVRSSASKLPNVSQVEGLWGIALSKLMLRWSTPADHQFTYVIVAWIASQPPPPPPPSKKRA